MKRYFAALLALTFVLLCLCSCSKAIIYDQEKEINAWLGERVAGYNYLNRTTLMNLFEGQPVTVKISTGINGYPVFSVTEQASRIEAKCEEILTVYSDESLYGKATNTYSVFDAYQNGYASSMRVYKNDGGYRIFFFVYGDHTDFYPMPRLLTEQQYNDMLPILTDYTNLMYEQAEKNGTEFINYLAEFKTIYTKRSVCDLAKNPKGLVFYQYNGTPSDYLSAFGAQAKQLGLTEQDWRESYRELGYTGYDPNYIVLYVDLTQENGMLTFTLASEDLYATPFVKRKGIDVNYVFGETLLGRDFITIRKQAKLEGILS